MCRILKDKKVTTLVARNELHIMYVSESMLIMLVNLQEVLTFII